MSGNQLDGNVYSLRRMSLAQRWICANRMVYGCSESVIMHDKSFIPLFIHARFLRAKDTHKTDTCYAFVRLAIAK